MSLRRLIFGVFLLFFSAMSVMAGLYFLDARDEYEQLRKKEAADRRKLDQAEKKLADQERTLERLRTDPEYVERVIRRKLGYAKQDETVFRFEDQ